MVGQAEILTPSDWARLEKNCDSIVHRTLWAVLRFTGARVSEALQLKVTDVYDFNGEVKDSILYRKETRKGKDKNLTIPVSADLRYYLERYHVPPTGYMFPSSRSKSGHLTYEAVVKYLNLILERAGITKHITSHSFRRSLITHLARKGTDVRTIQMISGHASIQNLQLYIDTDPNRIKSALEGAFS